MTQQTKTYLKSRFETGDRPTQADFADLIDSAQDNIALESVFEYVPTVVSSAGQGAVWRNELSIFSGWSSSVGVQPKFDGVRMKLRPHSGASPTHVKITVRDSAFNGTILAQKTVEFPPNDIPFDVIFDLPVESANELYLQFQADDKCAVFQQSGAATDTTHYITAGNQTDSWSDATSDHTTWAQFLLKNSATGVKSDGAGTLRNAMATAKAPRLNIGDKYFATTDIPLQLFHRSILESINAPNDYEIAVDGRNIEAVVYPRYIEIAPTAERITTLNVSVLDRFGNTVAAKPIAVEHVTPTQQPSSSTNVLCVGDSLTANGTYVTELNRMLTGSGGSPVGNSFGNIAFVGSQGSGSNKHEGHSGKDWNWFANDAGSPFVNGGSIDIANYLTANSIASIDHIYFLLTWNSWDDGDLSTSAAWAADMEHAKDVIDAFKAEIPGIKITLLGVPLPSLNGGLATHSAESYRDRWRLQQGVYGLNQAYVDVTKEATYSSYVDTINLSSQVDSENNMQQGVRAVNFRNAATETMDSDGIHPATEGYHQIADAVYRHFVGNYCS